MSKMKELYMKENYPKGDLDFDIEREHYINDMVAQEREYFEYEELKKDPEINLTHSQTKIEVHGEKEGGSIEIRGKTNTEEEYPDFQDEGIWL